jgi:choline dehydrogenase
MRSILTLSPTLIYCFWHSDEAIRNNDLQISFTPASYDQGQQSQLDCMPGFSIAAWPQRPESSGWVRAKTSNPFDKPIIQPNYLSSENDIRVLLSGIRLSRRIMNSEALSPFFDYEVYPGNKSRSDHELLEIARKRSTTCYHLMGTCKMGPVTDRTAVVDNNLKVHGIRKLRIIDASIMPMIPSANINASVLAVAEKGASLIKLN